MALVLGLSIAGQTAELAGQGTARALSGIGALIADEARTVRAGQDAAMSLARRANEYIAAISAGLVDHHNQGSAGKLQRHLGRFEKVLLDVLSALQAREQRSYVAQILSKATDADKVKVLSEELERAFQLVTFQMRIDLRQLTDAASAFRHLSAAQNELQSMSQYLAGKSAKVNPPTSFLPSRPQLFFGRMHELKAVIDTVCGEVPGHVAILGSPGIGKTSLAVTVLHDEAVLRHFSVRRYFVACDAAQGQSTCLGIISTALGITGANPTSVRKELASVLSHGPSLLVLDNFESAWEEPEYRTEAEDMLSFLAGLVGLCLIVTLRGSERPQGVQWTRPLLPPLLPLDEQSATQVFLSIADVPENNPSYPRLLQYLDNVPLAIVLAAHIAQYEPLDSILQRWDVMKTTTLSRSDGTHRLNSLDASISLSLESPRMRQVPDASTLLALLALLPNGAVESDIQAWSSNLRDSRRASAALIQTALAVRTQGNRIRVLAPIREFILSQRHPSDEAARPLRDWYFRFAELLVADLQKSNSHSTMELSPEVENLNSVIRDALSSSTMDLSPVLEATRFSGRILHLAGIGSLDILTEALEVARAGGLKKATADLLMVLAPILHNSALPGDPAALYGEALTLYESLDYSVGIIDATIRTSSYLPARDAVAACERMCQRAKRENEPLLLAHCYERLGEAYQRLGDPGKVRASLQLSIDILRGLGESALRRLGDMLYALLVTVEADGDTLPTLNLAKEALAIYRTVQNTSGVGEVCATMAEIYLNCGQTDAAVQNLELALPALRAAGNIKRAITCLRYLTSAYLIMANETEALRAAELLVQILRDHGINDANTRLQSFVSRAECAMWRGDLDEARVILTSALTSNPKPSHVPEWMLWRLGIIHHLLGQVEQRAGDAAAATEELLVAAAIHRKLGTRTDLTRALASLAPVLDDASSERLLEAVMLPLLRFGYRPALADALLHGATIARRKGDTATALHRARHALGVFELAKDVQKSANAREFLQSLSPLA